MGRIGTFALLNGVNKDSIKNFITSLYSDVLVGDTTIQIVGNYPYSSVNSDEYLIINSEVMQIISSTYNVDHTDIVVERGSLKTIPSAYVVSNVDKVYSAQRLNVSSLKYEKRTEFSGSDLFGFNLPDGYVRLTDTGIKWSPQDILEREYAYKQYQKIFIFELENNITKLGFVGSTQKLSRDSRQKQTSITFYDSLIKEYDKTPAIAKYYIDKTIKEVLEDLFDCEVIYRGGLVEADFLRIDLLNTKSFSKNSELINYIAKNTATRIYVENGKFYIINDLDPNKLTATQDIQKGVLEIDGNEDSYIKINKVKATYKEKQAYRDVNEFKDGNGKIKYFGSILKEPLTINKPTTIIKDNEYQVVEIEGLDTSYVTYGDSVILLSNGVEYLCRIIDVVGQKVQVQTGMDKYFNWSQRGWIDYLTGITRELTLNSFDVIYPLEEMPMVWKYAREVQGTDKSGDLKYPLLPAVKSFDSVASGIEDSNTITISSGDFNTYFTEDDYIYLDNGTSFDRYTIDSINSATEITVFEKLLTTYTNVSIFSSNGIEEVYTSFNFEDESVGEFSGTVDNIDNIWETALDNKSLLCAREYGQNDLEMPIYLYTSKIQVNSSGDYQQIYYSGFDNSDISLNISKSDDLSKDFISNLGNTQAILQSTLENQSALLVIGDVMFQNQSNYDSINAGDVLKLNKVGISDDRYNIYSKNKEFKWSVNTKEVSIATLNNGNVSGTAGSSSTLTNDTGGFASLYVGQQLDLDDGINSESVIVESLVDDNNIIVESLIHTHTTAIASTVDYIIYLDSYYPKAINGKKYEYTKYPYSSIIHLNEFFIRGNPIMQVDSPYEVSNEESIDIYGEIQYDLDASSLNEDNFKTILDHLKNSYASTNNSNTRSRFTFKYYVDELDVFDIINITETLYNGYDTQKALIISKTITWNESGVREIEYSAITLGGHTASAKNISLKKSLKSKALVTPKYTHRSNEGTDKQQQAIDTPLISLTDELSGNSYGLSELSNSVFSAKVKNGLLSTSTKTSTIEIYDLIDVNRKFNSVLKDDREGFLNIDGEYINFRVNRSETITTIEGNVVAGSNEITLTSGSTGDVTSGDIIKLSSNVSNSTLYQTVVSTGAGIILKNNINEGFKVDELSIVKVNLEIIRRGVFDTPKTVIGQGDLLTFYEVVRTDTKDGLSSTKAEFGDTTKITGDGITFNGKFFNDIAYVESARDLIGATNSDLRKIKINGSGSTLEYSGSITVTGQNVTTSDTAKSFLDVFEVGDIITLDNGVDSEKATIGIILDESNLILKNTTKHSYSSDNLYLEITTYNDFYGIDIKKIQIVSYIDMGEIDVYHFVGERFTIGSNILEVYGAYDDITFTINLSGVNLSINKAEMFYGTYINVGMLRGFHVVGTNLIKPKMRNLSIDCEDSPSCYIEFENCRITPSGSEATITGAIVRNCETRDITFNECVVDKSNIEVIGSTNTYLFDSCKQVTGNEITAESLNIFGGLQSKFVQFNNAISYNSIGVEPEYQTNNSWQTPYQEELDKLDDNYNTAVVYDGMEFVSALNTDLENIPDNTSANIPNKYFGKKITHIKLADNIDFTGVEEGFLNTDVGEIRKINGINDITISSLSLNGVRYVLDCKTPSYNCYINGNGVYFDNVSLKVYYKGIYGNGTCKINDSEINLQVDSGYDKFDNIEIRNTKIKTYDLFTFPYPYNLFTNYCRLKGITYEDNQTLAHELTLFNSAVSVVDFKETSNNANLTSKTVFTGDMCDLAEGVLLLGDYDVLDKPFRQSDNSWNVDIVLYSGVGTNSVTIPDYMNFKAIAIEGYVAGESYNYNEIRSDNIVLDRKYFIGNTAEYRYFTFTSTTTIESSNNFIVRVIGLDYLGGYSIGNINPNYFDKTSDTLDSIINGSANLYLNRITTSVNTGTTTVATFDSTNHLGAKYVYTISDGTNMRTGELLIISNGVTASITSTSTSDIGNTDGVSFDYSINLTQVNLNIITTTDGWDVKIIKFEI